MVQAEPPGAAGEAKAGVAVDDETSLDGVLVEERWFSVLDGANRRLVLEDDGLAGGRHARGIRGAGSR